MKHGELRCYQFKDEFVRGGVIIQMNSELFIVPVRCIKPRNPIMHIPLTIKDGIVKNINACVFCEDIEKFDKSKDNNIFFSNLTSETLEKIMDVVK
jgi:hypothetical protein